METYYIVSQVDKKRRIVESFDNLESARKFIQNTHYFIAFDDEAIDKEGYTVAEAFKPVKQKVEDDNNSDNVWMHEYCMRIAEGCNVQSARMHANYAVELLESEEE